MAKLIIDEVKSNFKHNVKEIGENLYEPLALQYAKDEDDPKHVLIYLYDDDQGASFKFRALSAEPVM